MPESPGFDPKPSIGRKKHQITDSALGYYEEMLTSQDLLKVLRDVCLRPEDNQSLKVLAKRSGWSRFYFHREFKRIVGETPKQFTQRLRLERAATLLATESDSVLTIALTEGFSSHEVFLRAFRRQFGCSPTQYRRKFREDVAVVETKPNLDLVHSVGPCVRLFHIPFKHSPGKFDMSAPEIERRELGSKPVLYIQRRVARTQLQPLFAECFPKLYGHCMQSGLAMAGQPIARYVSVGAGLWTVDCAIPLLEPASDEGEMQAGELQAGPVAFAIHVGPYEQLAETNAAVERWIEDNDLQANGPTWEVFVTDPAEHPDPSDWKTEVYWPIAE